MGDKITVNETDAGGFGNAVGSAFNLYDKFEAEREDSSGNKRKGSGSTPEEAIKNTY